MFTRTGLTTTYRGIKYEVFPKGNDSREELIELGAEADKNLLENEAAGLDTVNFSRCRLTHMADQRKLPTVGDQHESAPASWGKLVEDLLRHDKEWGRPKIAVVSTR